MSMGGAPGRAVLTLTLSSSSFISSSLLLSPSRLTTRMPSRVFLGFKRTLCSLSSSSLVVDPEREFVQFQEQPLRHSILLEKLRQRHLKDAVKNPRTLPEAGVHSSNSSDEMKGDKVSSLVSNFEDLGLSVEVMGALKEMGISIPTEIQCLGIPSVLNGTPSVLLGSHTGSGKTLAYMLPIVQMLRRDEALSGVIMKPKRPRAIVLCPTRELSEQVFRVAKSISHHARFRSTLVSGGGRLRPQEDSLNGPIDMVVGTPGRVLQHIEEGNMVYGDIKYLVLDEADTMFDRGFGPDIQKFLVPLKNRASKCERQSFQTVLVTATLTKAVQKLVDEEFQGILHLRTSTLHKKIASARHDFIKLAGSENKLEALLQVLEPSLAKGNKVMVFCNTLNSSRAVDHFLGENQIFTVNYHGEVPAEQRVVNLNKFKKEDGDCPTLVCTDLAARGLDLDVDHVVMFDFPLNSIDYLHRTGRTARMGAKGKVTSLVGKKDQILASRIEEAIRKNESLESLTVDYVRRDISRSKIVENKSKNAIAAKGSSPRTSKSASIKSSSSSSSSNVQRKTALGNPSKKGAGRATFNVQRMSALDNPSKKGAERASSSKPTKSTRLANKQSTAGKSSSGTGTSKPTKSTRLANKQSTAGKSSAGTGASNNFSKGKKKQEKPNSKLSVVGFRGRSSWNGKKEGAATR